jgi:hypothetical protein
MHLPLTAVIVLDNVGCNDPEIQMTMCMWVYKILHITGLV